MQTAGSGSCTFNNVQPGQILEITDAQGNPVFNLTSCVTSDATKWTVDAGAVLGAYKPFLGIGRVEVRFVPAGTTSITLNWSSAAGGTVSQARPISNTNFGGLVEVYQNNKRGQSRMSRSHW